MLDIELVLLAHLRKVVRQENVALLGEFIKHFLAFRGGKVDAHAALAPIGMFEERVAQRIELHPAHVEEAALRVAADRGLDLDERSEERRVGKEGVGTCRYGWARDH